MCPTTDQMERNRNRMKENWFSLLGSPGPQALLHGTKAVSGGTQESVMRALIRVDGSAGTLMCKLHVLVPE